MGNTGKEKEGKGKKREEMGVTRTNLEKRENFMKKDRLRVTNDKMGWYDDKLYG